MLSRSLSVEGGRGREDVRVLSEFKETKGGVGGVKGSKRGEAKGSQKVATCSQTPPERNSTSPRKTRRGQRGPEKAKGEKQGLREAWQDQKGWIIGRKNFSKHMTPPPPLATLQKFICFSIARPPSSAPWKRYDDTLSMFQLLQPALWLPVRLLFQMTLTYRAGANSFLTIWTSRPNPPFLVVVYLGDLLSLWLLGFAIKNFFFNLNQNVKLNFLLSFYTFL